MRINLYITLEPERGKAMTLAKVCDPELLNMAALAALREAENVADEMAVQDATLGQLQHQEASRLRQALELVLPEIRAAGSPAVVM